MKQDVWCTHGCSHYLSPDSISSQIPEISNCWKPLTFNVKLVSREKSGHRNSNCEENISLLLNFKNVFVKTLCKRKVQSINLEEHFVKKLVASWFQFLTTFQSHNVTAKAIGHLNCLLYLWCGWLFMINYDIP